MKFLAPAIMVALLALIGAAAGAQQVGYDDVTFDDGIMVTSGDVLNCPYRFIQPVMVSTTEDYGMGKNRAKIFSKLRNEAKKLGADAVVMVSAGGTHMTAVAFARRRYTGHAIRFVDRACKPQAVAPKA